MEDLDEQLKPVIEPGETGLWSGRSDPRVMLTGADAFLIPFSLFFSGFSVFWILMAATSRTSGIFSLVGVPFVVIGLYYLVGRFLVKWQLKLRTAYAITNRRAIVLVGRRNLQDSQLTGGSRIVKMSRNGQHLTVVFNNAAPTKSSILFASNGQMYPNTGFDPFDFSHRFPVAFYDVADVEGLRAGLARVSASTAAAS